MWWTIIYLTNGKTYERGCRSTKQIVEDYLAQGGQFEDILYVVVAY